jgi:hypothetical protein
MATLGASVRLVTPFADSHNLNAHSAPVAVQTKLCLSIMAKSMAVNFKGTIVLQLIRTYKINCSDM